MDYQKDAIHIAVATVEAGEDLSPGDWVGFQDKEGICFKDAKWIGIVNPFSNGPVKKGSSFQIYLKPNSVTSLTHNWVHPLFGQSAETKAIAENWLKYVMDYDDVFGDQEEEYNNFKWITEAFKKGELDYFSASGTKFPDLYNDNKDGFRKKFWDNMEIYCGVMATEKQRENEYFGCSC